MSAITHILTSRARIQRPTSYLLDKTAVVAGLSVMDRQPEEAVRMEVLLDGCTVLANASITFTATPSNEVLALTSDILKRGKVEMTAVAGMSLSLVTDGFVSVRAVNSMGQPVNRLIEKSASLPVRFFTSNGRICLQKPSDVEVGGFQMMVEPDADVISGDIVTSLLGLDAAKVGRITDLEKLYDFEGTLHHIEAKMENIQ